MKKIKYIALVLMLGCFTTNAQQDKKVQRADDMYNRYEYAEAIDVYERLVDLGYNNETIYKRLANSNYLNARYQNASGWYQKLFALDGANIEPEEMYKYALTLKSLGKYDESDQWMQKFKNAKSGDGRAHKFSMNPDYLAKIKENSGQYTIKNLAVNSESSDFSPSFFGEQLVFSSARDTGIASSNIHQWNKKSFLNLYRANASADGELSNPKKLSKLINKKTHESSTVFTKDGQTMYFTRNNSVNGRFARDENGVSRLKLYRANLVNGEWGNIVELPFNNDAYSVAHPTLNKEENKLYFASDMPGTRGLSDIFVVDIHGDGSFGSPKNMGVKINTEGRETFPFITDDNVLYFASDGHPGLGGLDVFATKINDMENLYIQNLGEPINSKEDDFSFIINETTKKGYFASNRENGKGGDDIYSLTELKRPDLDCNTLVTGSVIDEKTGKSLAGASIKIMDSSNNTIAEITSDANGNFNLERSCKSGQYTIVADKMDYEQGNTTFNVADAQDSKGLIVKLIPIKKAAPIGTDLIKYLNLEPIYFDLDKSFIRIDGQITMQKVLTYLNEFPEVHIQVRSHTDARASHQYNQKLSERRAKETVTYLLANGVDANRLTNQGFGETQLTNHCDTRDKCKEPEHQANRRSEFIVVKN